MGTADVGPVFLFGQWGWDAIEKEPIVYQAFQFLILPAYLAAFLCLETVQFARTGDWFLEYGGVTSLFVLSWTFGLIQWYALGVKLDRWRLRRDRSDSPDPPD